jgi:hypothetical protein
MNKPRINKSTRPLLAVAALVVAFSVVSAPMANALFYNYVRDAYTGWEAGAWSDLNADANVASGAAAVQANAGQNWMVEPLSSVTEGWASYGYLNAFYDASSAYRQWYMYQAFNDLANLTTYLARIDETTQAYSELAQAYAQSYEAQSLAGWDSYSDAYWSAPLDQQESAEATYDNCFLAYYDAKIANDDYYNYQTGQYAYNTWSSYGAPYYGTSVFLDYLYYLVADQLSNTRSSASYKFDFTSPEEYNAYDESLEAYFLPIMEYYRAYSEYYRGLSDYYEG